MCTRNSSISELFNLTKSGRFPNPNTSAWVSNPSTIGIEIAPTQSTKVTADKSDVFVFSHIAMEKSVVDSTMTGNLQYFKENYNPYKNNSGFVMGWYKRNY